MRGIRLETGQELFLGNCRLVILSEPAASERTAEVVDYLLSDHELRPGTPLLSHRRGGGQRCWNPRSFRQSSSVR